jgi:hypothetical protein
MRKTLHALIVAVAVLTLLSCGAKGLAAAPAGPVEPNDPEVMGQEWDRAEGADVYIVGGCNRLFKNGVTYRLCDPARMRFGYSVFASGGDVYVVGERATLFEGPYAVLWKNGAIVPLEAAEEAVSLPSQVIVAGGRVYVPGMWYLNAAMWVDGAIQLLHNDSGISEAYCVFASGGDIYVGGRTSELGAIWKNGVKQMVNHPVNGGRQSAVHSLFVSGDGVYAAVTDVVSGPGPGGLVLRALLWKNGEFQILPNNGASGANAERVFVSDGDVYVIGHEWDEHLETSPVLWKNGISHRLGGSGDIVRSLCVSGGNVYIAGYQLEGSNVSGVSVPTLWINGEPIDLRPSGFTNKAWSVCVVEKGK